MRLIDADAFDRALCNAKFSAALNEAYDADRSFEDQEMYYSTQSFRDVMRYRPTIDAAPVIHGKWIFHDDDYMPTDLCSICGCTTWAFIRTKYCPFCGAKMDLEEVETK